MTLRTTSLIGATVLLTLGKAFAQPAPARPAAAAPTPATAPAAAPAPAPPATPPPAEAPTATSPAPPTTTVAPAAEVAPPAAPEIPPPATPPVTDAPPPQTLAVGKDANGFFQPSALLQFWIYGADQDEDETFTFRIRRAEIRVKGDIVPKQIGYQIQIDPARALELTKTEVPVDGGPDGQTVTVLQPPGDPAGPVSILQDYFITFMTDYADVSLGQFKIPVSLEGYGGSSKLLFPERSLVSRAYGDRRDLGLRIEKKLGDYFGYSFGVFNGNGQNRLDNDIAKDAALRLEAYPIEGLTVATVGYTTVGKREASGRDRLEGDVRYDANDLYLAAEYIHAWDTVERSAYAEGHGAYLAGGYTFFGHLQPIARVGFLDRDIELDGDQVQHYELGIGWLFQKNEAKLQLAFGHFVPEEEDLPKRTEGTLAAQVSF